MLAYRVEPGRGILREAEATGNRGEYPVLLPETKQERSIRPPRRKADTPPCPEGDFRRIDRSPTETLKQWKWQVDEDIVSERQTSHPRQSPDQIGPIDHQDQECIGGEGQQIH
jgi:hypothetical protein